MKYVLLLLVIPIYAMAEYELFHKSDTNQDYADVIINHQDKNNF